MINDVISYVTNVTDVSSEVERIESNCSQEMNDLGGRYTLRNLTGIDCSRTTQCFRERGETSSSNTNFAYWMASFALEPTEVASGGSVSLSERVTSTDIKMLFCPIYVPLSIYRTE